MTRQKFSASGAEALFASMLIYSFSGVMIREIGTMWGNSTQVAVRFAPVFLLLIVYGLITKNIAKIPKQKLGYAVGLSIGFTLVVLFFTSSILHTTIANTLFTFFATNMITSFILGTFWLKEKVTTTKIIAILFALAGLSVYANAFLSLDLGIVFAAIAGFSDGVCNVFRKKLRGVDNKAVLRLQYGVGTIVTVAVALISGEQIVRTITPGAIIVTVIFACAILAAANLLLYGYQHFDVNIGSVILSSEIVFGALLGWIFYKEVPAAHELLGGALILIGAVLSALDFDRLKKQPDIVHLD